MFPESPVCTLYDDTKRNGFWVTGGEPGVIEVLKVWKWPIVHRSKFIAARIYSTPLLELLSEFFWQCWQEAYIQDLGKMLCSPTPPPPPKKKKQRENTQWLKDHMTSLTTWSVGIRNVVSYFLFGSRNVNFACKFHWYSGNGQTESSHNSEIYNIGAREFTRFAWNRKPWQRI